MHLDYRKDAGDSVNIIYVAHSLESIQKVQTCAKADHIIHLLATVFVIYCAICFYALLLAKLENSCIRIQI